jgi:signal transduction histidine kinase
MEVEINNRPNWFNLHKAAILDPDIPRYQSGPRTGLVLLLEDLTDLETLEAELAHSDRLASIGKLAASVAHEIGNPVSGIASLAQNLREEHDPETVQHSVEAILQQTKRITSIVRSLMNYSRSGRLGTKFESFPLTEILDDSIQLIQLTRAAKHVECNNGCPEDLQITGDRQRLSQVMVNLLTNACDASKPGDRIDVFAFDTDDWVQVEVMDQGEGIPESALDEIFEPFFTTKEAGKGTGLGLPMVRRIIEEHYGEIEIDSAPGIGTRIILKLPHMRDQKKA